MNHPHRAKRWIPRVWVSIIVHDLCAGDRCFGTVWPTASGVWAYGTRRSSGTANTLEDAKRRVERKTGESRATG